VTSCGSSPENAGAAFTTLVAPGLLIWFTEGGRTLEGWRLLPRVYAAGLVVTAIAFYVMTHDRRASVGRLTLAAQLAPLTSIVVWRLGFYYALVFGAFVALAQWIIPYGVNVYQMPIATAGMLAAVFSLPSGVTRSREAPPASRPVPGGAARFGARPRSPARGRGSGPGSCGRSRREHRWSG